MQNHWRYLPPLPNWVLLPLLSGIYLKNSTCGPWWTRSWAHNGLTRQRLNKSFIRPWNFESLVCLTAYSKEKNHFSNLARNFQRRMVKPSCKRTIMEQQNTMGAQSGGALAIKTKLLIGPGVKDLHLRPCSPATEKMLMHSPSATNSLRAGTRYFSFEQPIYASLFWSLSSRALF